MSGTKMTGRQPFSLALNSSLLSISIVIGRDVCAHSDSTSMRRYLPCNFPCTKGAANASAAQAAYNFSPVSKLIRCGVLSTVTG